MKRIWVFLVICVFWGEGGYATASDQRALLTMLESDTPEQVFENYAGTGRSIIHKFYDMLQDKACQLFAEKFATGELKERFLQEIAPKLLDVMTLKMNRFNRNAWLPIFQAFAPDIFFVPISKKSQDGEREYFVPFYWRLSSLLGDGVKEHLEPLLEEHVYGPLPLRKALKSYKPIPDGTDFSAPLPWDVYAVLGDYYGGLGATQYSAKQDFLKNVAPKILKTILEQEGGGLTAWQGMIQAFPDLLEVKPEGYGIPFVLCPAIGDQFSELAANHFKYKHVQKNLIFSPEKLFEVEKKDLKGLFPAWVYDVAFVHFLTPGNANQERFMNEVAPYLLHEISYAKPGDLQETLKGLIERFPQVLLISPRLAYLDYQKPLYLCVDKSLKEFVIPFMGSDPIRTILLEESDGRRILQKLKVLVPSGIFNTPLPQDVYKALGEVFKSGSALNEDFRKEIVPHLLRGIVEHGQENPGAWLPLIARYPELLEEIPTGIDAPFYVAYHVKDHIRVVAEKRFENNQLKKALFEGPEHVLALDLDPRSVFTSARLKGPFDDVLERASYGALGVMFKNGPFERRFLKTIAPRLLRTISWNLEKEADFIKWRILFDKMPKLLFVVPEGALLPFYLKRFYSNAWRTVSVSARKFVSESLDGDDEAKELFDLFNGPGGFYEVFDPFNAKKKEHPQRAALLTRILETPDFFTPLVQNLFLRFVIDVRMEDSSYSEMVSNLGRQFLTPLFDRYHALRSQFLHSPYSLSDFEYLFAEERSQRFRAMLAAPRGPADLDAVISKLHEQFGAVSPFCQKPQFVEKGFEHFYETTENSLSYRKSHTLKVRQFTDYYRLDYAHATRQTDVTPGLWDWLYANPYFQHTDTDHAAAAFWVGWELDEGRGGVLACPMIDSLVEREDAFRGAASMSASSANALRAVETLGRANVLAHELDLDLAPSGGDAKRVVSTRALGILKGADYGISPQPATFDEFKRIRQVLDNILRVQGDFALGMLGAGLDWDNKSLESTHQQNLYLLAAHDYADMTGGIFDVPEPAVQQWHAMRKAFPEAFSIDD